MIKLFTLLIFLSESTPLMANFFALDDANYRQRVCDLTQADLMRFKSEKYWLDRNTNVGIYHAAARQEWAENYVTTVALIEKTDNDYAANCLNIKW